MHLELRTLILQTMRDFEARRKWEPEAEIPKVLEPYYFTVIATVGDSGQEHLIWGDKFAELMLSLTEKEWASFSLPLTLQEHRFACDTQADLDALRKSLAAVGVQRTIRLSKD